MTQGISDDQMSARSLQVASMGTEGRRWGRRAVMGAAVPAVIAGVVGGAPPAHAAVPEGRSVIRTTLAALRAATTVDAGAAYLVVDPGAEGVFLPDPADTTSVDDTGLVVVTAAGERIKRVPEGHVSVTWFGARGDGVADDAAAIQAAVEAARATGRSVYFPTAPVAYAIASSIVLRNAGPALRLHGDSMAFTRPTKGSTITAHPSRTAASPLEALFLFDDAATATGFQFDHLTLNGNYATRYGIKSAKLSHTTLLRVYVLRTTEAAVGIGQGWCNDVLECTFYLNTGDGVRGIGGQVNMLNITNTKIFGNGGVGVALLYGSYGVRIAGCTIESNVITGVLSRTTIFGLEITGNYFERNGVTGFNDPVGLDRLIHAQIVILGGTPEGTGSPVGYEGPIRISGNLFSVGGATTNPHDNQAIIAAYDVLGGLDVSYNGLADPRGGGRTDNLVLTGTSRTGRGALLENLTIRGNGMPEFQRKNLTLRWLHVETVDLPSATTQLHTAAIEGTPTTNYAQALQRFKPLRTSSAGRFTKDVARHRNRQVYDLGGAIDVGSWGFDLDLAVHPELAGKLIYFACMVRTSDDDTRAVLSTSQLGDRPGASGAEWQVVSYVDRMPQTGTVSFGVRKVGGTDTSVLSISGPVLSEVGVRYELVDAV